MADESRLSRGTSLLSLPYDITEQIYAQVLDWMDLRLFLYVNEPQCSGCDEWARRDVYFPTGFEGVGRPQLDGPQRIARHDKDNTRVLYMADFGFGRRERPRKPHEPQERRLYWFPMTSGSKSKGLSSTNVLDDKYATLGSLLRTCKQIRAQFGEQLWRRQPFDLDIFLEKYLKAPFLPLLDTFLSRPFANGSPYESLRKFLLTINIKEDDIHVYNWTQFRRGVAVSQARMVLNHILPKMPNLRELTVDIPIPYIVGNCWVFYFTKDDCGRSQNFDMRYVCLGILNLSLKAFKHNTHIQTLHVSVYTPKEPRSKALFDAILKDWPRESWTHTEYITHMAPKFTKTKYTLERRFLEDLEKPLELCALLLPKIKQACKKGEAVALAQNVGERYPWWDVRPTVDSVIQSCLPSLKSDGTEESEWYEPFMII